MELCVLSWNLMHGRAVPGAGRDLLDEFTVALAGWPWDVALLQEVPPWWPAALARSLDCEQRTVLTSRNEGLALRRAIARHAPDLIKSGGGGANAILARRDRIAAHRALRLCRRPERRWVHAVQLGCGVWIGNLHATAHDTGAARRDAAAAAAAVTGWATGPGGRRPVVLGGDFNLRAGELAEVAGVIATAAAAGDAGLRTLSSRDVDHLLGDADVAPAGEPQLLEHPLPGGGGTLSDHVPLSLALEVAVP